MKKNAFQVFYNDHAEELKGLTVEEQTYCSVNGMLSCKTDKLPRGIFHSLEKLDEFLTKEISELKTQLT